MSSQTLAAINLPSSSRVSWVWGLLLISRNWSGNIHKITSVIVGTSASWRSSDDVTWWSFVSQCDIRRLQPSLPRPERFLQKPLQDSVRKSTRLVLFIFQSVSFNKNVQKTWIAEKCALSFVIIVRYVQNKVYALCPKERFPFFIFSVCYLLVKTL